MLDGLLTGLWLVAGAVAGIAILLLILWLIPEDKSVVKHRLNKWFKKPAEELPVIRHDFLLFELPSLQLALDDLFQLLPAPAIPHGIAVPSFRSAIADRHKLTAVRYRDVDIDLGERLQCVENGMYLAELNGERLAILVHLDEHLQQLTTEVMAATADVASKCLSQLRKSVAARQVYRGKVLAPSTTGSTGWERGWGGLELVRLPQIVREQIILPPELLRMIERNSTGFLERAATLRRAGQSVKRGLMFHGPPGTGKTYVVQWIAQNVKGATVILLSGEQLWLVRECCRIARLLAPALIIMEDVDLIAESREHSLRTTALHQLLNEMDGIGVDCDVLFLLTTNRPETIEAALASRPGRVDQAIEIPLPDVECRRQLLELFARDMDLQLNHFDRLIGRLESASPAFIKELVRKAALFAAELPSTDGDRLRVHDEHFDAALHEMTLGRSGMSRRLFGFAPTQS